MKFIGFCLRPRNKSGIILVVVLWVLAILAVLALGLGRTARIDLALVKHHAGKLRAQGAAWAGVQYAQNQLVLAAQNKQLDAVDTLYQCGFILQDGKTPEDIFKDVGLKDGTFEISYVLDVGQGLKDVCYGFQDEERRLNINGIRKDNDKILVHFFMLSGLEETQAQDLTKEVLAWHYGLEKAATQGVVTSSGYKAKAFENIEELLLLKGMTKDLFEKVQNDLTVFPVTGELFFNVNTASENVLKSLFYFVAETNPSVSASDADSLVKKIISFRQGDDGRSCTKDDGSIQSVDSGPLKLGQGEAPIYLSATSYFKDTSKYFRIHVKGVDNQYHVAARIEAVMDRDANQALVLWKRR